MMKKAKFLGLLIATGGLLVSLFLLTAFYKSGSENNNHSEGSNIEWPSRRDLSRSARTIRKSLLIYGTGEPNHISAYQSYAEKRARESRWLEVIVKPDTAVTDEELCRLPLFLIGTSASNRVLQRIQDSLPYSTNKGRIVIKGLVALKDQDVYHLSLYPNPLCRTLPISVVTGYRDESILHYLNRQNRTTFRAEEFGVYRCGEGIALGFFEQGNGKPWRIDRKKSRNYLNDASGVANTDHYRFIYHGSAIPEQEIREFAKHQEHRLQKLLDKLSAIGAETASLPKITFNLYSHLEDKGLITRNTDLSHFNAADFSIHALYSDALKGSDFYADAKLVISKLIGSPRSQALSDGLAMYFSHEWRGAGFRFWAKRFYDTDNAGSLSKLLDSDIYAKESYLFMRPLAGSFVDFLITKFGWQRFGELYQKWPASGLPTALRDFSLKDLGGEWLNHIKNLNVDFEKLPATPPQRHFGFQKGFCYAHEGYQIYNGYLSRKSLESLSKAHALGTDWISLTPFGYLQNAHKPDYLRYSFGPGSENDESLLVAASYAKQLDMGVMLKPHILMWNPHWGWPGDIKMDSEEEWQNFFSFYYNWIRHYALLAEMADMDIFCIGVELMQTTRDHQKEWREIIKRVRQIYHGPIVYAANWWQELEQITFWDDLDYIGLNCYYPLSQKDSVTMADLKRGAADFLPTIEHIANKYRKPVLLTEVGFTSTSKNWKAPHKRKRGAALSFEDQAMCYRATFEAFWDKKWLAGIYWWKWPTYLEYGGRHNNGFTPNAKPAENIVKEWYSNKKIPPKTSY
ncbi:MAG: hypothetical protein ACE5IR_18145 [bacterium]